MHTPLRSLWLRLDNVCMFRSYSPFAYKAQVGQVSTPTANVLQGLQKTTEANKTDDVVMLLLEEQHQAQQNGHGMPLSVVFVERKVRLGLGLGFQRTDPRACKPSAGSAAA